MQCKWLLITLLSLLLSMKALSNQVNQCSHDEVDCGDNKCIEVHWRCDGRIDCTDRPDEVNCKGNCDRIDCSINGWCSQECVNSIGSFECSCKEGFESQANNRTCVVPPDVKPLLLYAQGGSIKVIPLEHTGDGTRYNFSRRFDNIESIYGILGISVDPKISKIFWVDSQLSPVIYSADITEGYDPSRKVIVPAWFFGITDIAYDWIADNIYIADYFAKQIMVCRANGSFCSVLNNWIGRPYHLALDLPHGHIYWTTPEDIFRSGMDGSDVTEIVRGVAPTDLKINPSTNRLYWTDRRSSRLKFHDLDSGKLCTGKIYLSYLNHIAVFGASGFRSTDKSRASSTTFVIGTLDKFSGRNETVITGRYDRENTVLHIYHPSLYDESISNPCEGEPCSHLCLIAPGNSYKCACPSRMGLSVGQRTCETTFILVSQKNYITKISHQSIGPDVTEQVMLPRNFTISDFSFDPDSNTMYIFDCEERCSIIQCDLSRQNCEAIAQPRTKSVRGLTFDRMTKNLLWVDSTLGHLVVFSTATRTWRTLIDTGLERPVDLAINYRDRVIYIADLGLEPSILQVNMDGTQQRKMITGSDVGLPIAVTYSPDKNKLHWVDAEKDVIKSINVSDKNAVLGFYAPQNTTNIMSLDVAGNIYFFADRNTSNVYSSERLSSGRNSISIPPQREKSVKKIRVYEIHRAGSSACGRRNGGCSHICLPMQTGRICACSSTHFVDPHNYTNCLTNLPCEANELQCLDGVNCYPTLFACDGQKDCPDGSDELDCSL